MIGIILTGHGHIATGFESGMKLVFGEAQGVAAIDFSQEVTPEVLEEKLKSKIEEFNVDKGVLILTDIPGGTPFKVSSMLSMKYNNVKVVSGMNFPMILEVVSERDDYEIEGLYLHALDTGKAEVKGFEIVKKEVVEDLDDGI